MLDWLRPQSLLLSQLNLWIRRDETLHTATGGARGAPSKPAEANLFPTIEQVGAALSELAGLESRAAARYAEANDTPVQEGVCTTDDG